MTQKFQSGDHVKWKSQAGSYTKKKEGVILYVIPAGIHPRDIPGAADEVRDIGLMHRKEESYIVRVQSKVYWPRTCHLQLVRSVAQPG